MNSNTQLDLHPDAESLNAFVEEALAERERGQILAHLAGCSRCRQVVYLAQEAAAEMEMERTDGAQGAGFAIRHESWFRSWWFAWAPAAALAAIVALALYVHTRRQEMALEVARVTPQIAQDEAGGPRPLTQPTGMQATPVQPTPVAPTPARAAAAPAQPAPRKSKAAQPSAGPEQVAVSAELPSAAEANEPLHAEREEAAAPPATSGAGYPGLGAAAESKPEPAVAAWQQEQQRAAVGSEVHGVAAKTMARASADESAKREPAGAMLTTAAPAPKFEAKSAPSGSFDVSDRHLAGGAFAVYKAKRAGLPSELPVVSTATVQQRMLAVDQAGAVFLSEDSGSHWESVARQWTGRVVAVRRPMEARTNPPGAAPSPETVFEIVNDHGQVWMSTNGRTWKAE